LWDREIAIFLLFDVNALMNEYPPDTITNIIHLKRIKCPRLVKSRMNIIYTSGLLKCSSESEIPSAICTIVAEGDQHDY